MLAAFVAGALAGFAIAIPVGAIAVLIIETGIRRGFRIAAAAGSGAATADLIYATIAMVGGTAIAPALAPLSIPLRIGAIAFLAYLGVRGLARIVLERRTRPDGNPAAPSAERSADRSAAGPGVRATYLRFLGLTLLNPTTVVYFAALVLALPSLDAEPLSRPAFVVGAFLASVSWQIVLAAMAAVAHHRLPPRFQIGISAFGNLMICGFAVALAKSLLQG